MRWLSKLLVVSILCLVAIAIPAAPAQAICLPYGIELTPSWGFPGTNVTVYGHDFADDKLVEINYDGNPIKTCRTGSSGNFTLNFTVPEDCSGQYRVLADVGYAKVDAYFTVKPGLRVSPQEGPAGTNATVKGQGFARNEEGIELMYYLNDHYDTVAGNITANATGSWETSLQIPSSTRGKHKIDAQGAVSRSFEVIDATFRVTAEINLAESSGSAGDAITMTGSRFSVSESGIRILFDGKAVATGIKANSKGEWTAEFKVPDMPAGNYIVTAEGEQTRKEDVGKLNFELTWGIVLSPSQGHAGMNVTVTGHGFAVNQDVDVMYDGNQVTTAGTDDKGNFVASFAVPESQHGDHSVTAGYAGGNDGTAIFTMESNHPDMPVPTSPANGGRLGFMSGVVPTFEWSEVSDDSGVRYSLQIATSDDFAAPSIIASFTDLSETSYTLNETLPNGTYYWMVQTVDRAENESGWTAVRSFRVGLLPRWGFILVIAVAGAALLAFLIRALLRRRSIYYDRW